MAIEIDGKRYPNQSAAARALGVSKQAISARARKDAPADAPRNRGGRPPSPPGRVSVSADGLPIVRVPVDLATLEEAAVYCADLKARTGATMPRGVLLGRLMGEGLDKRAESEGWSKSTAVLTAVERNGGSVKRAAAELGIEARRVSEIMAQAGGKGE